MFRTMDTTLALSVFIAVTAAPFDLQQQSLDASQLRSLRVINTSGAVVVRGTKDQGQAIVAVDKEEFEAHCVLTIEPRGEHLMVAARSQKKGSNDGCKVNFEITVPERFDIEITAGSSRVDVDDTIGRVELRLGSGKATIQGEVTDLQARAGTGFIKVEGLTGPARVRTGSGDIELTYARIPTGKVIDIRTGSGDATVALPSAARVRARLRAGSGDLKNDFPIVDKPDVQITMRAGSGDLTIERR